MSLGNGNPTSGNKGSNFSYELKVLQGLQCACDQLKTINIDTDELETLLADILTGVQRIDNCVGADGTTAPASSFVVAGITSAGIQQTIEVNASGHVNISDGGGSITVDGTVAVSSLPSVTIGALPNEGQQTMANSISVAIASDQAGVQRTPTFLRPSGTSGTITAGKYSASFASVGTANATVGGITLKPGESLNFDAGAINNTLAAITYSTTTAGAELIIITLA
jgi:hypothetical protein